MRAVEPAQEVPNRWPYLTARAGGVVLTFKMPSLPSQRGRVHHRYASAMLKARGYSEELAALQKADEPDAEAMEAAAAKMLLHLEGSAGHLLADLWHPAHLTMETARGDFKGPDAALEYGVAVCEEVASGTGLTWDQISKVVAGIVEHAFPKAEEKTEVDDVEVFFGPPPAVSP